MELFTRFKQWLTLIFLREKRKMSGFLLSKMMMSGLAASINSIWSTEDMWSHDHQHLLY